VKRIGGALAGLVTVAVMLAAASLRAEPVRADAAYVEALVLRARELDLANQQTWRDLLHYRSSLFGWKSEADAKSFFVAPDGKSDPQAELEATLRGLFGPMPKDKRLEHPYCRFPARLAWLNSRLGFDFTRVPRRSCPRFQDFVKKLDARSLVLVFSSYYLNNPASAFGHTFLRVNKERRSKSDEEGLELLDYGIDYAAAADTSNAFIYGFKGLTGMFPGLFHKVPFYLKVREYNDYESRDLWEYELDLTREQVSMVLAHIWELGSNYFDYFYLSENCSYHILGALQVANPRLRLVEHAGWPVIPAETVKLVQQAGLVKSVHYRPSNRTQFRTRLGQLSGPEREMLDALVADPSAVFPAGFTGPVRARVLDAALDLVDFRFASDLVRGPGEEADPEGVALKQRLLERRAEILLESEGLKMAPPLRKMPHVGHDASRFGLGSGRLEGRGFYHAFDFRLALHDLADPSPGYPDEAAIEFLPLKLRYYIEDPALSLEDVNLIRVVSLTPINAFDKSWSWTVRAGGTRVRDAGCDGCFAGIAEFGAGFALAPFGDPLTFWLFADLRALLPVDGGLLDTIRAGIGPSGGVRLRLGEDLALLGSGAWHWLPEQDPRSTWEANGTLRWQYVQDFAFSLEARVQPDAISAELLSLIYF
jgi:hypothetical protein